MNDVQKKLRDDWKKKLTPEQYNVCRMGGTESPFSGKYYKNMTDGQALLHQFCCTGF